MFTEKEIKYLKSQKIARVSTFSKNGQADVAPVSYKMDGSKFVIPSLDMEKTLKYKNIESGNNKVAIVVDDLASTDPWEPRGIKVHGKGELVEKDGRLGKSLYIEIVPLKKWSWGINWPSMEDGKARFDIKKEGDDETTLEMGCE